ncbi:HEAT repeat domain-containing protein [Streptomyces sp. SudanB182_2057]|uniref:HEAT repeat domain-containing protein n=1 Tax=Streptomyces sp. SudanB182_2057 TaxID=3035281 RepID=UPI003F551A47
MIDEHHGLLAGLDDVDWAALSHAYGSAEDVPGRIRALCGADDQARQEAFQSLFSSIFHQGSRYQASAHAVPFLARIAVAGPPAARENTMWLLTRLAVDWHDEYDLTTGINTAGWRAAAAEHSPEKELPWYEEQLAGATDEDKRTMLREIRDWVAAGNSPDARWSALRGYDAVLAELPGLLVLLDDADPRIRTRIAYLLAWFPEVAATTLPLLLARTAREDDPLVAATALVAVGLIGTAMLAADLTPYLDADEPLVRWAAATALVRIAGDREGTVEPRLLDRAVAELTTAADNPAPTPVTDYNEGDFHGHIERTLHSLPTGAPQTALAACLPRIERDRDGRRTRTALNELFPAPLPHPLPDYADLPVRQRQLLSALAEQHHPWIVRWMEGTLAERGLPDSQDGLRAYVGLPLTD